MNKRYRVELERVAQIRKDRTEWKRELNNRKGKKPKKYMNKKTRICTGGGI